MLRIFRKFCNWDIVRAIKSIRLEVDVPDIIVCDVVVVVVCIVVVGRVVD